MWTMEMLTLVILCEYDNFYVQDHDTIHFQGKRRAAIPNQSIRQALKSGSSHVRRCFIWV